MKSFAAWILFIAAKSALAACGGDPGTQPLDDPAEKSAKLLASRDFVALDALVKEYRRPNSLSEDGRPNLHEMYSGLSKFNSNCRSPNESDVVWLQRRALLQDWRKASPDSTAPLLALATFDMAYGWHARGGGYASSVSKQGYALMQQGVESARQQMDAMPQAARLDPEWYTRMLDVGVSQGWPRQKFDALFDGAVKKFPEYLSFYYVKARFYSPQWYGSSKELVALMNSSAQGTSHIAVGLYARMYLLVDRATRKVDFKNGTVSYPKLKASYESLLREFPSNTLRNPYARYACIAEDWPVVRTQLDLIGNQTTDTVWNKAFYDWCQQKSAQAIPTVAQAAASR